MSLTKEIYQAYCDILKEELRLAMGCTEPIAIAYSASIARSYLSAEPTEIRIGLSGNIIKNTKSVVVPATGGMHGIAAAVAAGTVANKPELVLEVLSSLTAADVPKMKVLIESCPIEVGELDTTHIFEIVIQMKNETDSVTVRLLDRHTNLVYVEKNGEVLVRNEAEEEDGGIKTDRTLLTVENIVNFADEVNLDDVRELLERQISCNMAIAEEGMKNNYGACIGKVIYKNGNCSLAEKARAFAAAGSDARMNGCELPVCIISGSGNQGMTASIPVVIYARELGKSEDIPNYQEYKEGCKKVYQELVQTKEYSLDTDRQAQLVRPLALKLLTEEQAEFAKKRLIQAMKNYGWRLGTGFLSTPFILNVLSEIDIEAAYKLLENEEIPGWLSMPKAGATTIWESWEGPNAKGDGAGSLNHYSKGAVCQWLFETMCGIQIADENEFRIAPRPGGCFTHAKAEYNSVYGKVSCGWKKQEDGSCHYEVKVPANTIAKVVLPDGREMNCQAGKYEF